MINATNCRLETPTHEMRRAALRQFALAYIECALWADGDPEDGETRTCDPYPPASDSCNRTLWLQAGRFYLANEETLVRACIDGYDMAHAGHDFWLTRNGHGAGFWDGDCAQPFGNALTVASHEAGERWLYVSDAGELEISR